MECFIILGDSISKLKEKLEYCVKQNEILKDRNKEFEIKLNTQEKLMTEIQKEKNRLLKEYNTEFDQLQNQISNLEKKKIFVKNQNFQTDLSVFELNNQIEQVRLNNKQVFTKCRVKS